MSFLAEHFDPALVVPSSGTITLIEEQERERLIAAASVAKLCSQIPRRLGPDASSEDLARDKQRSRRVQHALEQCLRAWGGSFYVVDTPQYHQRAAQINWDEQRTAHVTKVQQRTRYIVTWARTNGHSLAWTKSAVVKLTNEVRWYQYALRD